MGVFALGSNTTGLYNVAAGLNALQKNTDGCSNVAVGKEALYQNSGNKNIAIGDGAGAGLTLGDENIHIGNYGLEAEYNTIRIGAAQEACFVQGIFNATVSEPCDPVFVNAEGKLGTVIEVKKYKQNITDMGIASEALMDLRPVKFTYKDDNNPHYGLIIEEVEEIFPELVFRDRDGNSYGVRYHELPVLLLNELQKHHLKFQEYEAKIQELENIIKKGSNA